MTEREEAMNKTDDAGIFFGEKDSSENNFAGAMQAYLALISSLNGLTVELKGEDAVDANSLYRQVEQFISIIRDDERMLLGLANAPYSYVVRQVGESVSPVIEIHGVNVMIYALKISNDLGVPEKRLPYIAMAALCHSLGLLNASPEDLRKFSDGRNHLKEINAYEEQSLEFVKRLKIDDFHLESVEMLISLIRENEDTLSRTNLHEAIYQYAMVIHICSTFEKLTHQKAYGEVFAPIDAMKKMRDEMKDYFHPDIIKLFFNRLSIYPLGSFVRLSSHETAKIIAINDNFVMRPVIAIVLDEEGREKPEPVRINLREKPNIYIKRPILDEYLTEKYIALF